MLITRQCNPSPDAIHGPHRRQASALIRTNSRDRTATHPVWPPRAGHSEQIGPLWAPQRIAVLPFRKIQIGGSRATVMSRSAVSASPALRGQTAVAHGRLRVGRRSGAAGPWGYWRERRGRNLIQARMATATSSERENRTAGMVIGFYTAQAVCGQVSSGSGPGGGRSMPRRWTGRRRRRG
jgi:hypothetical protein